jgi:hypothetical protein
MLFLKDIKMSIFKKFFVFSSISSLCICLIGCGPSGKVSEKAASDAGKTLQKWATQKK